MKREWFLPACVVTLAIVLVVLSARVENTRARIPAAEDTASMAMNAARQTGQRLDEKLVGEQVVRLPEDGGLYWTVVCVHADWQRRQADRELVAAFSANANLASLRSQTHFEVVTPDNRLYKVHFAAAGKLPCLYVQTEDGQVIYKQSGPMDSTEQLVGRLFKIFDRRPWLRPLPWRRPRPSPEPAPGPCPGPGPCPAPQPAPDTHVDVDVQPVIPDMVPPDEGEAEPIPDWALPAVIVGPLLAGAAVFGIGWRRRTAI